MLPSRCSSRCPDQTVTVRPDSLNTEDPSARCLGSEQLGRLNTKGAGAWPLQLPQDPVLHLWSALLLPLCPRIWALPQAGLGQGGLRGLTCLLGVRPLSWASCQDSRGQKVYPRGRSRRHGAGQAGREGMSLELADSGGGGWNVRASAYPSLSMGAHFHLREARAARPRSPGPGRPSQSPASSPTLRLP